MRILFLFYWDLQINYRYELIHFRHWFALYTDSNGGLWQTETLVALLEMLTQYLIFVTKWANLDASRTFLGNPRDKWKPWTLNFRNFQQSLLATSGNYFTSTEVLASNLNKLRRNTFGRPILSFIIHLFCTLGLLIVLCVTMLLFFLFPFI